MHQLSSNLVNIKLLLNDVGYKRNNDTTAIGLMSYSGLQSLQLMPELCKLLQDTFNLAEAGFFWSDIDGNFQDAWCTAPHFLSFDVIASCAQYQASGNRTWPTFTENVLMGAVCGYLLPFQNARFYASEHYEKCYAKIGVRHVLDLVLHDGVRPYGSFLLMRSAENGPFKPDERSYLEKLIPTITAAFSPVKRSEVAYSDQTNDGFALISREGKTTFMDTKAASVAWALTYETPFAFARPDAPKLSENLNEIIKPYISRALTGERFSWVIENRWGRFNLSFNQQYESDQIMLHMSKSTPLYTQIINKLHKLDLPPMRQMVALLLVLNHTRQEIASALGITLETATSHIKTLYKESNTQSSHALLLKLIG
ncbi:MAG: hypothetical protein WC696_06140 [Candidatus Methylopumilus sp.]|jgi:hypothetical protein